MLYVTKMKSDKGLSELMSYDEISEVLQIPKNKVINIEKNAMKKIRKIMYRKNMKLSDFLT